MDVIIAIDSESEYLDNTESLLSSAKYNFIKATEYKKGMDYAKTATPDLVMIGINRIDKELIDAVQFFKKMNEQAHSYSAGWSAAYGLFTNKQADIVLSYATSPIYHLVEENNSGFKSTGIKLISI